MSIPYLSATPPPFEDGGHAADNDDFGDFNDHFTSASVVVSSGESGVDDNIFFKPIERIPSTPHTSEQNINPAASLADHGLPDSHVPQEEINLENDNGSDEEDWSEFGSVGQINPDPAYLSTDAFGKFSSTASAASVDRLEFKAAESFSTDSGSGSNDAADADAVGLGFGETDRKNYNIPPPYENQSSPDDDQNEVAAIFQNPSPINAANDTESENSSAAAEPYSEDGSNPVFVAAIVQLAEDKNHSTSRSNDLGDECLVFAEAPRQPEVISDRSGEISQRQSVVISNLDSVSALPEPCNSEAEEDEFSEFASVPAAVDLRMTATDASLDLPCIPADESNSKPASSSGLEVEDLPSSPTDSGLEEPSPAAQNSTPPDDLEEEEDFQTFPGDREDKSGQHRPATEHKNEPSNDDDDDDENFQTFQNKSMFDAGRLNSPNCQAAPAEKNGSPDDNYDGDADEDEFQTFQTSTVVRQLDVPDLHVSPASENHIDEPEASDDFDDFEEFKTAADVGGDLPVAGTDGGDWAAFGEKISDASAVDDWAAFQESKSAETTESMVIVNDIQQAQVGVVAFTSSLSQNFMTQSLLTCFPHTVKSDDNSEVTSVHHLLTGKHSGSEFDSKVKRLVDHGVDIWNGLKVMENTAALKYQWQGSRNSELLLRAINVDARNILTGHRKPSAPVFAANLGLLEPKKATVTSDRLISTAGSTPVIQDASWRSNTDSRLTAGRTVDVRKQERELLDVLQLNDVGNATTAAKTRSTSLDTILKAITSSSSSTAVTAVPVSTARRLDGSTEPLSAEASAVLARLPDLSFMHAKVLMFPVGDCAN